MELYFTPQAEKDLVNIRESILEKFYDEELAKRVLRQITQSIRRLQTFPYSGQELSTITGIQNEYRVLFCQKNYVFYRVENDFLRIIRILNEKQDYMRILFGILEVDD